MQQHIKRAREWRHRERGSEREEAHGERERERGGTGREGAREWRHRERRSEREEAQGERGRKRGGKGAKTVFVKGRFGVLDSKESSKNAVSISIS